MTLIATLFPLLCWFGYNYGIPLIERRRPSLSVIMSMQRRRWVANMASRESPLDAILSGNLMGSISFLASTTVLMILAIFTAFGQLPAVVTALRTAGLGPTFSVSELQLHFVVMLAIFVLAFFAFTLALRQFNHFCIMIGAMDHTNTATEIEIDSIARLNTMAARNFNNGIRAYYFSVATVAWFIADWAAIAASVAVVLVLLHREFYSSAHRIAASAALSASKREQDLPTKGS